jgi:hypothetical protein
VGSLRTAPDVLHLVPAPTGLPVRSSLPCLIILLIPITFQSAILCSQIASTSRATHTLIPSYGCITSFCVCVWLPACYQWEPITVDRRPLWMGAVAVSSATTLGGFSPLRHMETSLGDGSLISISSRHQRLLLLLFLFLSFGFLSTVIQISSICMSGSRCVYVYQQFPGTFSLHDKEQHPPGIHANFLSETPLHRMHYSQFPIPKKSISF